LYGLVSEINHMMFFAIQRELKKYDIAVRQYALLCAIQSLGPQATIINAAKQIQREVNVVSRQTITLEKDGLIKRTKSTHKSTILTLELTDRGLELVEAAKHRDVIYDVFSFLSTQERQQMESILCQMLDRVKKYNR
jgi:DNA-binding MarR family transcriptional regulator